MQLIDPSSVQGSGHCVICEQGIDRFVQSFTLDTLFDVELPGHYLDGRKYICQGCVFDIGRVAGFARASEVDTMKSELAEFRSVLDGTMSAIRQSITSAAESLHNIPPVPNVNFIAPATVVSAVEVKEDAKPKRGRPSKESTF